MPGLDDGKLNDFEVHARESGIYKVDFRLWHPHPISGEKGWCTFRQLEDDEKATAIEKMKVFCDNLCR